MSCYRFFRPLLFTLPPEVAHRFAVTALARGLLPDAAAIDHPALRMQIGGVTFRNPVGLAAGFDKNGEAVAALLAQGFGFVECGTVTPRAQEGNARPRLFRLTQDAALINRMGFNNAGLEALRQNLARQHHQLHRQQRAHGAYGINIGKNKTSDDAVADYLVMLDGVHDTADYVTLNISSPNTPGLRDLQEPDALDALLDAVCNRREQLGSTVPLWLKVAPDMDEPQCEAVAKVVRRYPIAALVVGNTTLSRPESLKSVHRQESGGLSGTPLMPLSTARLRLFRQLLGDALPLVGVGGIASADDAYAKIRAGASVIQLYSALVYEGLGLIRSINAGLLALLKRDGYASLSEVIGTDVQ